MDIAALDTVSIVLLIILVVAILAILQTAFAIRHDYEISLAGPKEQLSQINARLEATQNDLKDTEESLRVRREALANIADIQAEVDALLRQKEELLQVWAQLEERRKEVRVMHSETEEAYQKKQETERDLAEKQESLELIQAKLDRADNLASKLAGLKEEEEYLEKRVEALRSEVADLIQTKEQAERLRQEVEILERDTTRLSGQRDAVQSELIRLSAETDTANEALAKSKTAYVELAAQVAVRKEEASRLDEEVRMLEARKVHLQREISDSDGEDPLKELKNPPEVLRQLAAWSEWNPADEAEALETVSDHLKRVGLEYSQRVVRAFHTAMKVNETTQMTVLAGISGTGKSQLPRQYAAGMGIGFLQVPVQPRWDSPQDLMGFYNYIEGHFRPTDMARALYHLDQFNDPEDSQDLQDRMLMILLDEMNLARVEYYFSDFLSRLESRPRGDQVKDKRLRKDSVIELEIPMPGGASAPRVFPGYNLLFAGTMNEDESTQSLSEKVVDRANVLRFSAPKKIRVAKAADDIPMPQALTRTRWSKWVRQPEHLGSEKQRVEDYVDGLVNLMASLQRPFGHRLGLAMISYAANYPELNGGHDPRVPIADQVEMRLLPKLRGVDVDAFEHEIKTLADFVREDLNDSVLAQALEESLMVAQSGTGSFLWRGVMRA